MSARTDTLRSKLQAALDEYERAAAVWHRVKPEGNTYLTPAQAEALGRKTAGEEAARNAFVAILVAVEAGE